MQDRGQEGEQGDSLSGQSRRPPPLTRSESVCVCLSLSTHTTCYFNFSSEQTAPHVSPTTSPPAPAPARASRLTPAFSPNPSFLTQLTMKLEVVPQSQAPGGARLSPPPSLPLQPPTRDPASGCSDGSPARGAAAPWTRPDTGRRAREAHRAPGGGGGGGGGGCCSGRRAG